VSVTLTSPPAGSGSANPWSRSRAGKFATRRPKVAPCVPPSGSLGDGGGVANSRGDTAVGGVLNSPALVGALLRRSTIIGTRIRPASSRSETRYFSTFPGTHHGARHLDEEIEKNEPPCSARLPRGHPRLAQAFERVFMKRIMYATDSAHDEPCRFGRESRKSTGFRIPFEICIYVSGRQWNLLDCAPSRPADQSTTDTGHSSYYPTGCRPDLTTPANGTQPYRFDNILG
jgi:hypothetical protein